MIRPARDVLTVFWKGEETAGFTVYGLRKLSSSEPPEFPFDVWGQRTDYRESRLSGDLWEVIVWDVRVLSWPSAKEFREALRQTLEALLEASCKVAWLGLEGVFVDPPDLFLPEFMSGGVLAALSDETGFQFAIELDEPVKALKDDELYELRRASCGLAESG